MNRPDVETPTGKEWLDIMAVCEAAGMTSDQIHAALLGHIGVCASAWGNPWLHSRLQSPISPDAATGDVS